MEPKPSLKTMSPQGIYKGHWVWGAFQESHMDPKPSLKTMSPKKQDSPFFFLASQQLRKGTGQREEKGN